MLVAAFDRIARSTRNFLQVVDELDSLGIRRSVLMSRSLMYTMPSGRSTRLTSASNTR